MASPSAYQFDVYISHSPEEREWVDAWLLPRLEEAGLQVYVDYRDSLAGAPRANNIERAMKGSRRTVAVVTPAWVASEWNLFEDALVRSLDPAALRRRLIPIKLKACDLPESLAALESVDLTAERRWEQGIRRLRRDLEDVVPVAAPWRQDHAEPLWTRWRRWLRRYRREVRLGTSAAFAAILLLLMLVQAPPFQKRLGWQGNAVAPDAEYLNKLARFGEVLLVASTTDRPGCDRPGLWRSTDQGLSWRAVLAPLSVNDPSRGCFRARVTAFSAAPDTPSRIYASTSDVGLLRSDDAGLNWARVGAEGLPDKLTSVAVSPELPSHIFVAAEAAGLYRSQDDGRNWLRLDAPNVCSQPEEQVQGLPENLDVRVIVASAGDLYVGTDGTHSAPTANGGIYRSQDGGLCWRQIDMSEDRYYYVALAAVPPSPDVLLALTYDTRAAEGEPSYQLWQVNRSQGRLPGSGLLSLRITASSLYVEDGVDPTWYVTTGMGGIHRGTLDGETKRALPPITRCVLAINECYADMAAGFQVNSPLLLAADRVYRLTQVPWQRRLWP